jgi:hypothetical protein
MPIRKIIKKMLVVFDILLEKHSYRMYNESNQLLHRVQIYIKVMQ